MVLAACPAPPVTALGACAGAPDTWMVPCDGDTEMLRIFYDGDGWPMYSTNPGLAEGNFLNDGTDILIVPGAPHVMFARLTVEGVGISQEAG